MSHLRVLICRAGGENQDKMTELASFDMPEVDVTVSRRGGRFIFRHNQEVRVDHQSGCRVGTVDQA